MTKLLKTAFTVLFALGIVLAVSAVPLEKTIGYSGYLRDAGGPISGTRELVFKIYDVDTGGAALWDETYPLGVVTFTDGEFTVALGSITPFSAHPDLNFHSNTQYWLGITIGVGGPELSPRKKLLFVPYTFSSDIETRTTDPATLDLYTGRIWLRTDL
jgi:hypothetical protein